MGRRRDFWDTGYNRASRYREDVAGAGGSGDAPGDAIRARVSGGRGGGTAAEFKMAQLAVTLSCESRQGGSAIGGERVSVHHKGEQLRGQIVGELVDTSSLDVVPASFERPAAVQAPTTNKEQLMEMFNWEHSNFESAPTPIFGTKDWGHPNLGFTPDTTGESRSQRLQLPTSPPPPPPRSRVSIVARVKASSSSPGSRQDDFGFEGAAKPQSRQTLFTQNSKPGGTRNSDRLSRLNSNVKTLYHQTKDDYTANKIIDSQKFVRGKPDCWVGSGIYFALTPEDAARKANYHGPILVATVMLGNVKEVNGKEAGIKNTKFRQLLKEGYDSVCIHARGDEYVIYNWDQATNIHRYKPDVTSS